MLQDKRRATSFDPIMNSHPMVVRVGYRRLLGNPPFTYFTKALAEPDASRHLPRPRLDAPRPDRPRFAIAD